MSGVPQYQDGIIFGYNEHAALDLNLTIKHLLALRYVADNFMGDDLRVRIIEGERCIEYTGKVYKDIINAHPTLKVTPKTLSKITFADLHNADILLRVDCPTGDGVLRGFVFGSNYTKLCNVGYNSTNDVRQHDCKFQNGQGCTIGHRARGKDDTDGTHEIDPVFVGCSQKNNHDKAAAVS